jgi:1-acyl-sn-glycerol-3-phosphate acyltransferase
LSAAAGAASAVPRVSVLRAAARVAATLVHALHGLAIVLVRFPRLDAAARQQRIAWWSATLLRRLGLRLDVQGRFRPGATMLVVNHVSWLDIAAIHAVCPGARFVAKDDVRRWPVLHRLVSSAGTLYLARDRRRDALRVVHEIAGALRAGDTVAVFPEGTTGDGVALLPFHANLLQAAIAAEAPVQPVALRYADPLHDVGSPAAVWVGDTTLVQSLWRLARADGLRVEVRALPSCATRHADRRALARRLREEIRAALSGPSPQHTS